ncbi:unnamed protein product [Peniophora sp. CBMAI 1063]|nr:unnamed protein product [Peniophora sp. CBMAI 1063]
MEQAHSASPSLLATLKSNATTLYARAWGVQWPRQRRTSVAPLKHQPSDSDSRQINTLKEPSTYTELKGRPYAVQTETYEYEYDCLTDINSLVRAFHPISNVDIGDSNSDVLVVLADYDLLVEFLMNGHARNIKAMAVTGQPGCGMALDTHVNI